MGDFVIKKGILTKYKGPGGDVVIPDGITGIGEKVFRECKKLNTIRIPDGVKSIGKGAFEWCVNLTEVTFPEGIETVGNSSFAFCSSLKSIVLPDSVKTIEWGAFWKCSNMTSITIPRGTTTIERSVFYGCSKLTICAAAGSHAETYAKENKIPVQGPQPFPEYDVLTAITVAPTRAPVAPAAPVVPAKNKFSIAQGVLSQYEGGGGHIVIPDGVTRIGSKVFKERTDITGVTLPDGLKEIGFSAFDGCTNLTNPTFPDSLTTIGGWVFDGCRSLTAIKVPERVTSIGNGAFRGCTSLKRIEIPEGVTDIGTSTFSGCDGVTICAPKGSYAESYAGKNSIAFEANGRQREIRPAGGASPDDFSIGNGVLVKYQGAGGDVVVPDGVTSIGAKAFKGCVRLTGVTLPAGLTKIAFGAFDECENLAHITFPDSLTTIDGWVFDGCKKLTTVTLPNRVTSIGNGVFRGCTALTRIEIPSSVTSIGTSTFSGCGQLTIHAPGGSYAESYAKTNRIAFQAQTVPEQITRLTAALTARASGKFTVQNHVLQKYEGSGSRIVIPSDVTRIDSKVFKGNTQLTEVTLQDGLKEIGFSAFDGCTNLTRINFPDSLTKIDGWAFDGCSSLADITFPKHITSIGNGAFRSCTALKRVEIPQSVDSIGVYAFVECKNLTMYAPEGSYAESYAKQNNIPFRSTTAQQTMERAVADVYTENSFTVRNEQPAQNGEAAVGELLFSGSCQPNQMEMPSNHP